MTRRITVLGGISIAAMLAACAVGCQTTESPEPSEATSGPVARALQNVRAEPSRALADLEHDFVVRDVIVDKDGSEHVRFDRTYKGLRVIGGDIVVHGHVSGRFESVSGTLERALDIDVEPKLEIADAIAVAQGEQVAAPGEKTDVDLVVYAREGVHALAWEIVLDGMHRDMTPSELHVFVDAHTGEVLESWEGIEQAAATGTGKGFFVGQVTLTTNSLTSGFELRDPSRGNQYTTNMANKTAGNGSIFTDADNTWGDFTLTNTQTVGVDAQYGTSVTWDYFLTIHGRSGIANNGVGAFNRVHYGRKYNNAFWSDSCFCMTYGDGDGTNFNPFDSLDVAGHEMTHGVTSRTAKLVYSGESGGLNEATSDIFGTMVEFYANNPGDPGDYLVGEMLYKNNPGFTKALRFMYDPAKDTVSKGCYASNIGTIDVHYSSGVANHFFYLLAEGNSPAGGPASPICTGATVSSVTGIGRDKAAAIWYRALTIKFTSSTNYANARVGTISAANDLYGAGSSESAAVAAAWSAVLVN